MTGSIETRGERPASTLTQPIVEAPPPSTKTQKSRHLLKRYTELASASGYALSVDASLTTPLPPLRRNVYDLLAREPARLQLTR